MIKDRCRKVYCCCCCCCCCCYF